MNPGYDELLREVRILKLKASGREELSKQCDRYEREIVTLLKINEDLRTGHDNLLKLYDALVTAVSKDAQKFSDLLVENDERISRY